MNIWRFTLLSFAGAYPWSIALAWAGYALGENWERVGDYLRPVSIPIVVLVVVVGAYFIYRRIRELSHPEEQQTAEAGPP